MKQYIVKAVYRVERDIIIEAENPVDACQLDGNILEEEDVDTVFQEVISFEEI